MFLDSIQYVFDNSVQAWSEGIQPGSKLTAAEQLIARQSTQRGNSRLHRIVFSGLSEVDDPEIRNALKTLYQQFHHELVDYVSSHRRERGIDAALNDEATAWAMIGLGSIFDIQHDLGVGSMASRRETLGKALTELLSVSNTDTPRKK